MEMEDVAREVDFGAGRRAPPRWRAAADCLCMLAATAKDAAPATEVWERALDAASEHEMFDVARLVERAQLARVESG